jgi:DNA-binding FadR family transcriptional regulator
MVEDVPSSTELGTSSRELVDALSAGNPDWAESVMRSHVRAAWSIMCDYVDTAGPQ